MLVAQSLDWIGSFFCLFFPVLKVLIHFKYQSIVEHVLCKYFLPVSVVCLFPSSYGLFFLGGGGGQWIIFIHLFCCIRC